jgi:hypothetical protein
MALLEFLDIDAILFSFNRGVSFVEYFNLKETLELTSFDNT